MLILPLWLLVFAMKDGNLGDTGLQMTVTTKFLTGIFPS